MLRFITVQLNQTPSALSAALENIGNFTGTLIKQLGELNGFDEEAINDVKFVLDEPKALLGQQTVEGALNWPLLVVAQIKTDRHRIKTGNCQIKSELLQIMVLTPSDFVVS
ncbi:hypothetical protein [Oceanicoccus sp. KOV_DT_Chl]|uniref:hypothetical protein n=1 Tax=Oceanicoccus sp. KOV_DT_Chl TaxID=1904639 RepID=UPI000C7BA83C|nr:hypothetical protein [Oceanicoccus sp. KOV_DT_Chl]